MKPNQNRVWLGTTGYYVERKVYALPNATYHAVIGSEVVKVGVREGPEFFTPWPATRKLPARAKRG